MSTMFGGVTWDGFDRLKEDEVEWARVVAHNLSAGYDTANALMRYEDARDKVREVRLTRRELSAGLT